MAFTITLYNFNKRHNSTKRPSGGTGYSGTLKANCGICNPSFTISLASSADPSNYNYAYIAEFTRYYFVDEWTWTKVGWECKLSVDVLATWKPYIGDYTTLITRSSARRNVNIMDDIIKPLASGSFAKTDKASPWEWIYTNDGFYVVAVLGNDTQSIGAVNYYLLPPSNMHSFVTRLFDNSASWFGYDFMQFIVSCKWYPLAPDNYTANQVTEIPFGQWKINVISYQLTALQTTKYFTDTISIPKHPDYTTHGNYLNCPPFTRYLLLFHPFGNIPLDGTLFATKDDLYFTVRLDYVSGEGELVVSVDGAGNRAENPYTVTAAFGTVGVDIPLAQSSINALGVLYSAVGIATGVVTENPILALSSAGNALQSALPQVMSKGCDGGSFYGFTHNISLIAYFADVTDNANTTVGRPLMQNAKISDLGGYMVCAKGDVSIPCTSGEHSAIKSFLEGGFYYE